MNTIVVKAGVSGHITMAVSGGARGDKVLADFDNMVLNAGLDRIMGGTGIVTGTLAYCQVGTDNTAVTETQTALVAKIAATSAVQTASAVAYTSGPPDYLEYAVTFRFATGAATGNLREVGFGWAATASLFSRALTTNALGAPTDVTVLADEQLDVTYRVRIYPPAADVTGSIALDGTTTAYTIRASSVSDVNRWDLRYLLERSAIGSSATVGAGNTATQIAVYSGALGARTGRPAGTETVSGSVTVTPQAYVGGTFYRDILFEWPLGSSNVAGGFKSLTFGPYGNDGFGELAPMRFQMEFVPNVNKDATRRLRLTMRIALARA